MFLSPKIRQKPSRKEWDVLVHAVSVIGKFNDSLLPGEVDAKIEWSEQIQRTGKVAKNETRFPKVTIGGEKVQLNLLFESPINGGKRDLSNEATQIKMLLADEAGLSNEIIEVALGSNEAVGRTYASLSAEQQSVVCEVVGGKRNAYIGKRGKER